MATHAPIPKTSPTTAKFKAKKGNSSVRSLIGRTPDIRLRGDIVTSAWEDDPTPKDLGTVIAAGKFKATCLELLDRAAQGETITITKRGKIVGRLIPPEIAAEKPFVPLLGRMEGMVRIEADIVGPRFDWWEKK